MITSLGANLLIALAFFGIGGSVALGFAAFVAAAGIAECFEVARPWFFWGFLLLGWGLSIWRARRPTLRWAYVLLPALVVGAVAGYWWHDGTDDMLSYFVLPVRLLAQGHLGDDILNVRRTEMGLGAASYLHGLYLSLAPFARLASVEGFLGTLLLTEAVTAHAPRRHWPALVALLLLGVVCTPACNIMPINTGTGLLVAAFYGAAPGLLLAACVALKGQFLLLAAPIALHRFSWRAVGVGLLVLAPWMVASFHHIGTPLYPLLGHGHVHTQALSGFVGWPQLWRNVVFMLPTLVLTGFLALRAKELPRVFLIASAVVTVLGIFIFQVDVIRYLFPLSFATIIVLAILVRPPPLAYAVMIAYALIMAVPHFRDSSQAEAAAQAALVKAQAATPVGASLAVHLGRPYLLDFARNNAFIIDWPGSAWPDSTATHLPDALRESGLRYVLVEYADSDNYVRSNQVLQGQRSLWVKGLATNAIRYHEELVALRSSAAVLYDDGQMFVADLGAASSNLAAN